MKYLVAVDNFFPDHPSGSARVAFDIATLANVQGHDVTLLCNSRSDDPASSGVSTWNGMRIVRFHKPRIPSWHPFRLSRMIGSVRRAVDTHLAGESFDVVHGHTPIPASALASLRGVKRRVYTMHSPAAAEQKINWAHRGPAEKLKLRFGLRLLRKLERGLLTSADRIHVLSDFMRGQVEVEHGFGSRSTVIPHWVRGEYVRTESRIEARRRLDWPQNIPILFTLRRHVPRMGIDVALAAIGPAAKRNACQLVIGGDGPLRPQLERSAAAAGLGSQQVVFTGRLSDEHLLLAYQAADLFVLPTLQLEGFGLIIIEALAMGCPVLATDAGAIPEILSPVLPDFIVPAGDVAALASKAEAFLSGNLRPPPSAVLSEHAGRRFGLSVIGPRLTECLFG